MKFIPNAVKFGNQSRSSSLIINMIFETATRKKKLGQTWSQNCNVPNFYEVSHSEQIEHATEEALQRSFWEKVF